MIRTIMMMNGGVVLHPSISNDETSCFMHSVVGTAHNFEKAIASLPFKYLPWPCFAQVPLELSATMFRYKIKYLN